MLRLRGGRSGASTICVLHGYVSSSAAARPPKWNRNLKGGPSKGGWIKPEISATIFSVRFGAAFQINCETGSGHRSQARSSLLLCSASINTRRGEKGPCVIITAKLTAPAASSTLIEGPSQIENGILHTISGSCSGMTQKFVTCQRTVVTGSSKKRSSDTSHLTHTARAAFLDIGHAFCFKKGFLLCFCVPKRGPPKTRVRKEDTENE